MSQEKLIEKSFGKHSREQYVPSPKIEQWKADLIDGVKKENQDEVKTLLEESFIEPKIRLTGSGQERLAAFLSEKYPHSLGYSDFLVAIVAVRAVYRKYPRLVMDAVFK